ncbi:MAG: serine--tRNA ligase [Candidatus Adiutrix intracellularis]|nr:MAG: serine--tRNA ligase [Candidatus Adiutrix intracellularis]MDR2826487.1 serine--tRNA ligase [Candidatus Adiutrix intracellularis]
MLDLRYVRDNLSTVEKMLADRNMAEETRRGLLSQFSELDKKRRELLNEVEALKARRNQANEEITALKKMGRPTEALIADIKSVSGRIKAIDPEVSRVEEEEEALLLSIPNRPDSSVPVGLTEAANVEVRRWGTFFDFAFTPKNHWEIGENLGLMDFVRAGKITGSRFVVLSGAGAALTRALMNFMLDLHVNRHGYREIWPPCLINSDSMRSTGQLPKFSEESFKIENTDYWLAPTAEVPVTNLHRDEILENKQLPISYTAYTPCFRAEAGAAGRDTRGMIRVHQFDKVELIKFTRPEDSWSALEQLTRDAEEVLQALRLPYRVVCLSTGDIGFSSAKTYDLEVWLPGPGLYREISSCSCFTDFQARRANIRFRRVKGAKPEFVHTLNGSGLAIGRTLLAILENYQNQNGSVIVPEVLRGYLGGLDLIK